MRDRSGVVVAAVALCFMAIVMVVFAVFALTDIANGEPDLSLEWAVVRATLAVVVIALGLSLGTISGLLRGRREDAR